MPSSDLSIHKAGLCEPREEDEDEVYFRFSSIHTINTCFPLIDRPGRCDSVKLL